MTSWKRFGLTGLVAATLGGVLFCGGRSDAGDEAKRMKEVQAIADALKQGKTDVATDLAKKLAKNEADDGVYYVMYLMKPRDKKGFGVGKAPGDVIPDGIELKIQAMGRDVMSGVKLKKEADALQEMSYRIKAIALFAEHLPPERDKGKLTKKAWLEMSKELKEMSGELEKALQSGSTQEVKKAAAKVNANCNQCHSLFK